MTAPYGKDLVRYYRDYSLFRGDYIFPCDAHPDCAFRQELSSLAILAARNNDLGNHFDRIDGVQFGHEIEVAVDGAVALSGVLA